MSDNDRKAFEDAGGAVVGPMRSYGRCLPGAARGAADASPARRDRAGERLAEQELRRKYLS
jgi:hypothetical protein